MYRKMAIALRACAVLAVIGFVQDARADCTDGRTPELQQRVALLKRTGDCGLVPGVMAASDQAFAYGVSHCAGFHRTKSRAQVEREMRRFCRTKSQTQVATSQPSKPPTSAPTTQPVAPSTNSTSKSASCSDITGTDSTTSVTMNCKDGNTFLHAARVTRKKYGVYAQEQYKKAAASFRLAGDIRGAEAAEHEAAITDDVFDAQQKAAERATDAKKQQSEGEANERIAEKIEEGAFEDGSCADLEVAASYYRDAARAFLDADVNDKASLDVQRDVRLGKIVKKAQAEGLCNRKLSTADRKSLLPPSGSDERADDPNDCAGMRVRLAPAAPNPAWIDDQMSRSNCHPDGTPMTLRERAKAALERANP